MDKKTISLDTETTGVDTHHGAKPFLVTTCFEDGVQKFWEWDVDPYNREPQIPDGDLDEIRQVIADADTIAVQNGKFDAHALATVGIELPWSKLRDTFTAGHLLASNHRHNLTDMTIEYLGVDIEPFEQRVRAAVQKARGIVRRELPEWRIAEEGDEMMPSVKGSSKRDEDKPWKNDMWILRALVQYWDAASQPWDDDADVVVWLTLCSEYANADSAATLPLWRAMEAELHKRSLWKIYLHQMNLPRIAFGMENHGVTMIGEQTERMIGEYELYISEADDAMVGIAAGFGHKLELADGASLNDNMRDFFYGSVRQSCPRCPYEKRVKHWAGEKSVVNGQQAICPKCAGRKRDPMSHILITERKPCLALPIVYGKRGTPSLDADAMQHYAVSLDDGPALDFINTLQSKRSRGTALSYMRSYRRFWLPHEVDGFWVLHPTLNPSGTDHLRWASYNPNGQNISKKESECEECDGEGCEHCGGTGISMASIRNCFGPAPGREWWSMDFQNIELRIPAYESGEEAMIELFERPNDPPYFGSYHLLNASIVYPEEFWPLSEKEGAFKHRYKATIYQWVKNGGFALQYGCGERKADATFRKRGAFKILKQKLARVAALNDKYVQKANRNGYVETMPDKEVDPDRGYPILVSRTDDGRVLSTTPLNYHISGTACHCKNTALVRCDTALKEWRRGGFDAHIAMEVHDEILFDFPRGTTMQDNLQRALELKRLMELSGDQLLPRVPTPVSVEYHVNSWAEGTSP